MQQGVLPEEKLPHSAERPYRHRERSEYSPQPDQSTDSLRTYSIELDACVAVGIANSRIESIWGMWTQNENGPYRVFVLTLARSWLRRWMIALKRNRPTQAAAKFMIERPIRRTGQPAN